jgi:hypothetical protein
MPPGGASVERSQKLEIESNPKRIFSEYFYPYLCSVMNAKRLLGDSLSLSLEKSERERERDGCYVTIIVQNFPLFLLVL